MSDTDNKPTPNPLDALRKLLLTEENHRIEAIEERFEDDKILAHDVASVLVEAIQIRDSEGKQLRNALTPTIEQSIKTSIEKNPENLSNALFPIMAPSIRKSVNNAIEEMLQSLTQTLDNSFSAQGLRWRWDAFRTGKTFPEVVLLNTLVYRVEQAFLIHKETGLLLRHLSYDPALNEDADVVSSMLTAVRDFVQDSFAPSGNQQIRELSLGDLEIKIESNANMVLALVCRGTPPQSLHAKIQDALSSIQQSYYNQLEDFEGDTSPFEHADDELNPLMLSDFEGGNKGGSPLKAIILLAIVFLGMAGWWSWSFYQSRTNNTSWENYITQLQNEPGIIIANDSFSNSQQTISGLRDPLSTEPASLSAKFDIDSSKISFNFEPYYAVTPEIVLKRVQKVIQAPASIQLSLDSAILYISGESTEQWLTKAQQSALFIPGIEAVDVSQVSFSQAPKIKLVSLPEPVVVAPTVKKPEPKIIKAPPPKPELPLSDAEILRREIFLLKPPATVTMNFAEGILHVSGASSSQWIDFAENNFMRVRGAFHFYTRDFSIIQAEQ